MWVDKEKNSVKILSGNIPMTVKLSQVEPADKKTVKELSMFMPKILRAL